MSKRWQEPVRQRTVKDGDTWVNDWKQPGRRAIIEQNLRDASQGQRKSEFGQIGARIPTLDREVLSKTHPEAMRGNKKALEKFLNSSEGRIYRTTPRGRSRSKSFGGI
jgi:hypothetical protein